MHVIWPECPLPIGKLEQKLLGKQGKEVCASVLDSIRALWPDELLLQGPRLPGLAGRH